jgi:hypothetical protein
MLLTIPKAGNINTYTSGCPKNQKRCWNKTGSPPPTGMKYTVAVFLSKIIIVIAAAKTGKDSKSRNDVISIDHTNKFNRA